MTAAGAGRSYDLVLKGGRVIDERNGVDGRYDVAIKAGKMPPSRHIDAAGADP